LRFTTSASTLLFIQDEKLLSEGSDRRQIKMKRSKLLLALTMMLVLIACLLSVPVLSGENPWDADGGYGGGTGSPMDSVKNDAGMTASTPAVQSPAEPNDDLPGWFSRTTIKMSAFIMNYYYKWTSRPALKYRYAY
jgi:hypothetical protein